jgi:hypothetical protein
VRLGFQVGTTFQQYWLLGLSENLFVNSFKQVAVFPSRTAEASDLFCTLSAAYELLLHHDQKSLIVFLVLTGREQERTTALVVLSCWVVVCCCLVLLVVRHVRNLPHYG